MKQIEHDMVLLSKGLQNSKTGIMSTHMMTTKGGKGCICNTGVPKSSEDRAKREGFFVRWFVCFLFREWCEEEESLIKKIVCALGLTRWMGSDRQNGRKGPLKRTIRNVK